MPPEELVNQAIATFNQRDATAYTALFTEDAVLYDPFFPEPTKGREEIAALVSGVWGSFSDARWELVGPVVAADDRIAFVVAVQMTHDGPMPMPDGTIMDATGERISFESGVFWTLDDDGLVAEERGYFNATAVAMQLGLPGLGFVSVADGALSQGRHGACPLPLVCVLSVDGGRRPRFGSCSAASATSAPRCFTAPHALAGRTSRWTLVGPAARWR